MPAQRPSWNYRAEDGGGIVLDMFSHWNYVLENLFGRVEAVTAKAVTHIPERWDEQGRPYAATADDAAYGIFELDGGVIAQINSSWAVRVDRDELVEFQVDGTHGIGGRRACSAAGSSTASQTPEAGLEPRPADHRGLPRASGSRSPTTPSSPTASGPSGSSSCADVDAGRAAPVRPRRRRARAAAGRRRPARRSREGRRVAIDGSPRDRIDGATVALPHADGGWREVELSRAARLGRAPGSRSAAGWPSPRRTSSPTRAAENVPGAPAVIDWDATLGFRRHLFRTGSASPRRWTPPSATWAWTGRPRRS